MSQPMQNVPVSRQIEQLREQLLAALVEKEEAEARLKAAEEKVTAIRNVFAGVSLGQGLQKEIDAANQPKPEATPEA